MNKKIFLLLLLFAGMANAQNLVFEDISFKAMLVNGGDANFIAWSNGERINRIDTNFDNEIQASEAALVNILWMTGSNAPFVTSIVGIEGFTNLTEIYFNGINATTINLDGMQSLENLLIQNLPALTSASFTNMPSLTGLNLTGSAQLNILSVTDSPAISNFYIENNTSLETLTISNLPNLERLTARNNNLSGFLDLTGFPLLQACEVSGNALTSLNVSGLTQLEVLFLEGNTGLTTLNAAGCTLLTIDGGYFVEFLDLVTADFSNTALQYFFLRDGSLETLNLSGCSSLQQVDVRNNNLTSLNLAGSNALSTVNCSDNQLTELNVSNSTIIELIIFNNLISNLNVTGCNDLITLLASSNQIPSLDLSGYTNLQSVSINDNPTATLNLAGCTNLTLANTQNAPLVSANFSGCSVLNQVYIYSNVLSSVNLEGANALTTVYITSSDSQRVPLTSINVSGHTNLTQLFCFNASLTSANIEGCTGLTQISLNNNPIATFDFSGSPAITLLDLANTRLPNVDVSNLLNLESLSLSGNPYLEMVFAKNGRTETMYYNAANTALRFICDDEADVQARINYLLRESLPNVVVNSYCSFIPGGDYNTITGTITLDVDNNGCDATDAVHPNVRIDMNDGTEESATFTNAAGEYTFYTGAGSFDLAPSIENTSLFAISPTTTTIAIPNTNNNIITQNFCITPVGSVSDTEIVIAPIAPAKPGFMALYQIVIKNKGNQTVSGSFNVTYNQELLHYALATLAPDVQTPGLMGWNYTNLLPFEERSFYVGLNVNTPTQTPPANLGDILNFVATVNPIVNDFTPEDNQFIFNQTVVGSYDPNDITCIQGESVSPGAIGEYLHYVVNFENTGTAAAENIVVRVAVDETKYDINSLQLLNASHASRTIIRGNVAEFIFPNINLGAAGNPPVNGHGNVLFKIKTLSTLISGDTAAKRANIYFDYNAPIDTNQALTTFGILSNPEFNTDASVMIFPNPVKDFITVNCNNAIKSVELFDVQGRIIQTLVENSNSLNIDVSGRASGVYFLRITTQKGTNFSKLIKD